MARSSSSRHANLVDRDDFLASLERRKLKVLSELRSYLTSDQDANAVHDLRTSIRRLDACVRLLPRKNRRKKRVRKYVSQLDGLLKMNTSVRDADLLLSRLEPRSGEESIDALIEEIKLGREAALSDARVRAKSIATREPPPVGKVSRKDLERRFGKVVQRLDSSITDTLPLVLSDPKKVEELHEVRKKCKRLRYSLELAEGNRYDETIRRLIEWQDLLGSIHDNDVILGLLEGIKSAPIDRVAEEARTQRERGYGEFVRSCMKDFGESPPRSLLRVSDAM